MAEANNPRGREQPRIARQDGESGYPGRSGAAVGARKVGEPAHVVREHREQRKIPC